MQERREQRSVSREVVEVVKALPASEAVLLFVFKDPKGRMALTLRHDLREAGVDTDALTPEGRSRVNVLTWGSETSLNDYAHCRHVILAGVLHRSLLDLASVAVGQLDNRAASLGGKWLLELMKSEVAHAAFQAISRGCCREVDQGQAKPMDAYVILPWALEPYLAPVMPGAVYEVWTPVYSGISDAVVTPMALAILQHLRGLPQATRKVSTKTIKAALCIPAAQRLNFSRAVQQLADLASGEWVRDGHSLVRTVDSLGFLSEAA